MRLLDPDVGEIADRQSILQLKIDAGMKKNISTAAWEDELKELDMFLAKKIQSWQRIATSSSTDDFSRLNAELGIVNARLWQAEDQIRALRKTYYGVDFVTAPLFAEIARLALCICDLNDARSELVRKINTIFGANQQEKIYA